MEKSDEFDNNEMESSIHLAVYIKEKVLIDKLTHSRIGLELHFVLFLPKLVPLGEMTIKLLSDRKRGIRK